MKIAIIGAGFVGKATAYMALRNSLALGTDAKIIIYDRKPEVLAALRESNKLNGLDLTQVLATVNLSDVYGADIVFVCINTNALSNGKLDCSGVSDLVHNLSDIVGTVVIRSTLDADFFRQLTPTASNVYYMPEFLREASTYADAISPSRVVVGGLKENKIVTGCLGYADHPKIITCGLSEAVVIKLFSNAYLAMRLAFFNELEDYCFNNSLNVQDAITGITADERIGSKYCTPSVAFGGYCLPKDTSTLQKETGSLILGSVLESNEKRILDVALRYRHCKSLAIVNYEPNNAKYTSVSDKFIAHLLNQNPGIRIEVKGDVVAHKKVNQVTEFSANVVLIDLKAI